MDLLEAACIDVEADGGAGKARRAALPQCLRIPLFNPKAVEEARERAAFNPTPDETKAAANYARKARSATFAQGKADSVRQRFYDELLGQVLGYRKIHPDGYTLAFEHPIRRGSVDAALGRFGFPAGDELVAPFALKGPAAVDLDAVQAGRGRSPVQQAWDDAIDAPGARWVFVSNCREIRLYGFGRGREAFERFDLTRLDEPDEHARLWLILSAERFLGGPTDALLRASDNRYEAITADLYRCYRDLRNRLMAFLTDSADGPGLAAAMAIEQAQTILDRILFIAFAQGTGLIARPILQEADKAFTPFSPVQKWRNFQNLFRLCERGLFDLDITAFNGGLFAPDPVTDAIVLSDDLATDLVRLSEWDYGSDVPVTMLGHIFEQSITDLERLRAESLGLPVPDDKAGQRKREGIVYTPDLVTRFLVERTLERTLAERFAALLAKHAENDGLPKNGEAIAWRGAAPPERAASERAFWTGYLAALQGVTVLDPACGAGAFLVAAFDSLAAEYRRTLARLADLGESVDLDPFDEILSRNLHGVDLNAESVEITRLSLWLKAARRKHKLPALEATIMVGDSLVGDGAYTRRPFDYETAFPSVFARGGFDVVLGNPPYVRMEFLKKVKPYFERHFRVAADRTDLCAFFFERGVALLTPGGRLGYISSSTFFRTGSGEKLRMLLADETAIEAVVDFGDGQIFEGVTTYPAILTLRKPDGPNGCGDLSFMKIEGEPPRDLGAAFEGSATPMPRTRLGAGSWHFENDRLAALRAKIVHGRKTLGEVYGPPLYGIKTGLNDAFVIDRGTRDRLAKADPKASELMRPYVRGEHIERWRLESGGEFLLNMPKGKVDIDEYPSVRDWLLQFRDRLEGRATKQQWFELQQAQLAYQANFAKPKILFVDIAKRNPFMLDTEGFFIDCTAFMVNGDFALLAFLNSKLAWFQWCGQTPIASGGYLRLKRQYVAPTLLPDLSGRAGAGLSALSEVCSRLARQRHSIVTDVRRGILDLAPSPARRKLARKLENWHDLDFAGFLAEVRRAFKIDVPLRQRREWESFLAESRAAVGRLSAEIESAERDIDAIVYELFDLTPAEIGLLESSLRTQF